jgi:hypothetical protein
MTTVKGNQQKKGEKRLKRERRQCGCMTTVKGSKQKKRGRKEICKENEDEQITNKRYQRDRKSVR